MVECKDCKYCERDWIGDTRSDFRHGDDYRYYCNLHHECVYEDDTCDDGEE